MLHTGITRVLRLVFVERRELRAASKLSQRACLDLTNVLGTHAEHGSNFIECVLTFVSDGQRAVARWLWAMLAVAAMLEVVTALGLATDCVSVSV